MPRVDISGASGPAWVKDTGRRTPRGAIKWAARDGTAPEGYLTPADAEDILRRMLADAPRRHRDPRRRAAAHRESPLPAARPAGHPRGGRHRPKPSSCSRFRRPPCAGGTHGGHLPSEGAPADPPADRGRGLTSAVRAASAKPHTREDQPAPDVSSIAEMHPTASSTTLGIQRVRGRGRRQEILTNSATDGTPSLRMKTM